MKKLRIPSLALVIFFSGLMIVPASALIKQYPDENQKKINTEIVIAQDLKFFSNQIAQFQDMITSSLVVIPDDINQELNTFENMPLHVEFKVQPHIKEAIKTLKTLYDFLKKQPLLQKQLPVNEEHNESDIEPDAAKYTATQEQLGQFVKQKLGEVLQKIQIAIGKQHKTQNLNSKFAALFQMLKDLEARLQSSIIFLEKQNPPSTHLIESIVCAISPISDFLLRLEFVYTESTHLIHISIRQQERLQRSFAAIEGITKAMIDIAIGNIELPKNSPYNEQLAKWLKKHVGYAAPFIGLEPQKLENLILKIVDRSKALANENPSAVTPATPAPQGFNSLVDVLMQ